MSDIEVVNTNIENSGDASVNIETSISQQFKPSQTRTPRAMYGVVNLIGRSSEGGGEIFGNYVDNKAYGLYSTAFGNYSIAGKKICKLDSLIDETNQTITLNSVLDANVQGQYFSYKINNGTLYSFAAKVTQQQNITETAENQEGSIQKTVLTFDTLFLKSSDVPTANDYIWFPEFPEIGLSFEEIEELLEYTPAFSAGNKTYASGTGSVGFGYNNLIPGSYGLAAGLNNKASYASAVFGRDNQVFGNYSLGAGLWSTIKGDYGVALGRGQFAFGRSSVAIGDATADEESLKNITNPQTEWNNNKYINAALADYSFALGKDNLAIGTGALAFGYRTKASGNYAFAFGNQTTASGLDSLAFGNYTEASGKQSISLGFQSKASGERSLAITDQGKATGKWGVALGRQVEAQGEASLAVGYLSKATKINSVAIGRDLNSDHQYSVVFGQGHTTSTDYQTIIGKYSEPNEQAQFIIGNGTSASNRKNIFWVNQDGTVETSNDLHEFSLINVQIGDIQEEDHSNVIGQIISLQQPIKIEKTVRIIVRLSYVWYGTTDLNGKCKLYDSTNKSLEFDYALDPTAKTLTIIGDLNNSSFNLSKIELPHFGYYSPEYDDGIAIDRVGLATKVEIQLGQVNYFRNYLATTSWVDKYISNIINTTSGNSPSAGVNVNNISQLADAMNLIWNGNTDEDATDQTIEYLYYDKDNVIQTGKCKIEAGFSGIASIYDEFVQGPTEEEEKEQALKLWTIISGSKSFNDTVKELACTPSNDFSVASGKTASFGGNVTISGNATINGTTTLNDNLTVASGKTATFDSDVAINGITSFNNNLTVASGKTATFGGSVILNDSLTVASGKKATFGGETEFNGNIKLGASALTSLKQNLSLRQVFFNNSTNPLGQNNTASVNHALFTKYNIFEIEVKGLKHNCLVSRTSGEGTTHLRGINGGASDEGEIIYLVVDIQYIPAVGTATNGTLKVLQCFYYRPYKRAGGKETIRTNIERKNVSVTRIHGIA